MPIDVCSVNERSPSVPTVCVCVFVGEGESREFRSSSVSIKCGEAAKRSKQRAASIWQQYQDNSEVTESLLPSCCLARGTKREANVVLFLGKSLITTDGIRALLWLLMFFTEAF